MTSTSPTQNAVMGSLGDFLVHILPPGTPVVQAQVNRVAPPSADNYVVMNVIRRERLTTNLDEYLDCAFTASASINVLTVISIQQGKVLLGATVFGALLVDSPTITEQLTGSPGGVGTYQLSAAQPTIAAEQMASGAANITQETKLSVQIDVHGSLGGDNAQTISTLFRDEYAVTYFSTHGDVLSPLYADDPRQLAFINEEQQYEQRWIVEATMQVNEVVTVPQQFAGVLDLEIINVDERYPAS